MNLKDQLALYKWLLFRYRLALIFPFLKGEFDLQNGFCFAYPIEKYVNETSILYCLGSNFTDYNSGLWFPNGKLKPRIALLKAAIVLTKEMIRRTNPYKIITYEDILERKW
jgi:hypothetical protein